MVTSHVMLILASRSPRRSHLLALIEPRFSILPAETPEVPLDGESPDACALRLAREKARAVALWLSPRQRRHALVLAADTVVALGRIILGKPRDEKEARGMLRRLSGKTHRVITGVAIWRGSDGCLLAGRSITRVTFDRLRRAEIDRYIATGEPMDAAGAYAIQGYGGVFIPRIEGSYSNVVGLPLDVTARLLRRVRSRSPD